MFFEKAAHPQKKMVDALLFQTKQFNLIRRRRKRSHHPVDCGKTFPEFTQEEINTSIKFDLKDDARLIESEHMPRIKNRISNQGRCCMIAIHFYLSELIAEGWRLFATG